MMYVCYMEKYDLADKDYQKIISIDIGNVMGYMGIGLNANAEKGMRMPWPPIPTDKN